MATESSWSYGAVAVAVAVAAFRFSFTKQEPLSSGREYFAHVIIQIPYDRLLSVSQVAGIVHLHLCGAHAV